MSGSEWVKADSSPSTALRVGMTNVRKEQR
jgi:hypothetical protein